MTKPSRRTFLQQIGAVGATTVLAPTAQGAPASEPSAGWDAPFVPLSGKWQFRLDPEAAGESHGWHLAEASDGDWAAVDVPHTWQVAPEWAEYQGVAWYRKAFNAPAEWAGQVVRIEFEAVNHSATVWLNGKLLGRHLRSGYTTFTLDASAALKPGGLNTLAVKVDNAFDEAMLPRGKSFDWTVDGGIIRPVNLLVSPAVYIERVEVESEVDLAARAARIALKALVRNTRADAAQMKVGYRIVEEDTGKTVLEQAAAAVVALKPGTAELVSLPPATLASARLWHFDHPHLYRVVVELACEGQPPYRFSDTFGIRKIEAKKDGFYLNGERVRLMGVERMAGSHPDYGLAEPAAWIKHDHDDMKELNCIFTRVHWQQDKRVLDYCDRHGILIQEEVPAWGPDTFKGMSGEPSPEILQNGLDQLREMIRRDRNHPSIFAWGLCNEVNGQNPPAQAFIQRLAEEARKLDRQRLLTYASNSLQKDIERDVAGLLDFIEWNEYYESWFGGTPESVRKNIAAIHQAFPDKPMVVSEYGYCECTPERLGGDPRRIEILKEHTNIYREFDYVAGAIFFCYNDYRTHIGDKGRGVLKQRVHGVVDLYGNRKPSFEALREESSPFAELTLTITGRWVTASLRAQHTLPSYALEGYTLRCIVYGFSDLPVEQHFVPLPKLAPDEGIIQEVAFEEKTPQRIRVDLLRPTGFSARTAWWKP